MYICLFACQDASRRDHHHHHHHHQSSLIFFRSARICEGRKLTVVPTSTLAGRQSVRAAGFVPPPPHPQDSQAYAYLLCVCVWGVAGGGRTRGVPTARTLVQARQHDARGKHRDAATGYCSHAKGVARSPNPGERWEKRAN